MLIKFMADPEDYNNYDHWFFRIKEQSLFLNAGFAFIKARCFPLFVVYNVEL